jgi:FKBP-type peptidyl-prolyl cis-trans isomerase FkpA
VILRRSFSVSGVLFLVAAVSAGCGGSPTTPTAPFSQSDVRVGTGASAASGNTLSVNYTGWIYDASQPEQKGAKFESSIGSTPLSFVLGAGQVIPGWDQGIPGMRVGGLRRLVIPPSLAYGGTRNGPIPPNATLVFEVELLSVE